MGHLILVKYLFIYVCFRNARPSCCTDMGSCANNNSCTHVDNNATIGSCASKSFSDSGRCTAGSNATCSCTNKSFTNNSNSTARSDTTCASCTNKNFSDIRSCPAGNLTTSGSCANNSFKNSGKAKISTAEVSFKQQQSQHQQQQDHLLGQMDKNNTDIEIDNTRLGHSENFLDSSNIHFNNHDTNDSNNSSNLISCDYGIFGSNFTKTRWQEPIQPTIFQVNKCSVKKWICNFPPLTDRATDQTTDQRTDRVLVKFTKTFMLYSAVQNSYCYGFKLKSLKSLIKKFPNFC